MQMPRPSASRLTWVPHGTKFPSVGYPVVPNWFTAGRTGTEVIMIKPRILVTGATGKTGSVVVTELLQAGYPVRALVHREDGRSERLRAQGAEIAVAEMCDVERVADALKDVQRAYYCPPFEPYMIQGAVAFAVAAQEA